MPKRRPPLLVYGLLPKLAKHMGDGNKPVEHITSSDSGYCSVAHIELQGSMRTKKNIEIKPW